MAKVLSIGVPELSSHYELANLDSNVHLDDYEAVVFDSLHYLRNALPKGMEFMSVEATHKMNAHLSRRASEIWRYIEKGGLIVYFPHSKLEYKGYVNNSVKTLFFNDLIFDKNLTPSVGQNLQISAKINEKIRKFLNKLQGLLIHRVILPNYAEYETCLESKDQGQIVGSYKLHESGGGILILPTLSFSNDESLEKFVLAVTELREDIPSFKQPVLPSSEKLPPVAKLISTVRHEPSSKANSYNNSEIAREIDLILNNTTLKVNTLLTNSESSSLPDWHADYELPQQKLIAGSIESLQAEINNLIANVHDKKAEYTALNSYKLLVTAQGKPLDKIITTVLVDMGIKVQDGPLAKGDLIGEYKDQVLLISVRGREGKGALEADAANLEKWSAKYFEETGKLAKPLLIVNGYLDKPLHERPDDIFPPQMLRYSTQRDHSLITGLQLLCLYAEAAKNPEKQAIYVDKLIKNVGVFADYKANDWNAILTSSTANKATLAA